MFINTFALAQELPKKTPEIKPETKKDTTIVNVKTLLDQKDEDPETELNTVEIDTTKNDSIAPKQEYLEDIIRYKATDYVSINRKEQQIYLYNNAEVYYQDMEIKSGIIIINYAKDEIYAGRIKDSLGNYSQAPVFTQGSQVVEPDSIRFNTKTKKALIWNSRTEQNDFNVFAPITKRVNDSTYFMQGARFTTSENLDDPEYEFITSKIKLVPDKKIVTGSTNMEIYGVPTPIWLPFGFFPLTDKHTSGIIIPAIGDDSNRGFNIQNGGYYFAISDYLDLAVLGDYFTNGSYGLRIENNYALRYRFRGNLNFRYENLITSERGFPDFAKTTVYNIRWSHSQDAKSNPNSRFSASVNLGSSRYYQESINQLNVSNRLNNNLSSSISYSKTFPGEPLVNISLTATHSQNSQTEQINMTLPTLQGSVDQIFPFAPKDGIKKGVFQNINFQYNIRGENRIQTTDSLFFTSQMFDDARAGIQHSIPISTNFKLFKHLSLSASTNFQETWTFNTINRFFDSDPDVNAVVTKDVKGFDNFRTYNFSASLGTTLYGLFNFGKEKKIQALRHVMRPSISYNINPAFNQYFDTYEVIDADGTTREEEYTRFEQSIFGSPTNTFSSSIGLSLGNNFEAKVRDRDSTATEPKKIVLLNNLNFSTSYNIAGDSLNWSPLRVSGGTQLFNNKMNVNFGATLDPYALDNNNNKIDEFNINNGGSLFRLTSANLTLNYSLSSKSFEGNPERDQRTAEESLRNGGRDDDLFGKPQDFADQRLNTDEGRDKQNEDIENTELYNFKIPWSLRLAYALNYNNSRRQNEISSQSLMFSGDLEISPRWSIGASSGYDLKNNALTPTQLRFERDLLSWRLNFSWYIPSGSGNTQWNFFIGIRSSVLKDIKYEKRRRPDRTL